ncbi:hypothetical protein DFH06DRAFT_1320168 [Mycena polygramma]|nr:hypothetical protein DFH06DRAFT_1320168 [Mycena polygramma]
MSDSVPPLVMSTPAQAQPEDPLKTVKRVQTAVNRRANVQKLARIHALPRFEKKEWSEVTRTPGQQDILRHVGALFMDTIASSTTTAALKGTKLATVENHLLITGVLNSTQTLSSIASKIKHQCVAPSTLCPIASADPEDAVQGLFLALGAVVVGQRHGRRAARATLEFVFGQLASAAVNALTPRSEPKSLKRRNAEEAPAAKRRKVNDRRVLADTINTNTTANPSTAIQFTERTGSSIAIAQPKSTVGAKTIARATPKKFPARSGKSIRSPIVLSP